MSLPWQHDMRNLWEGYLRINLVFYQGLISSIKKMLSFKNNIPICSCQFQEKRFENLFQDCPVFFLLKPFLMTIWMFSSSSIPAKKNGPSGMTRSENTGVLLTPSCIVFNAMAWLSISFLNFFFVTGSVLRLTWKSLSNLSFNVFPSLSIHNTMRGRRNKALLLRVHIHSLLF